MSAKKCTKIPRKKQLSKAKTAKLNAENPPILFRDTCKIVADNGYDPVPITPGKKSPMISKWTTRDFVAEMAAKPRSFSQHALGLKTARTPMVDLDIDDEEIVTLVRERIDVMCEGVFPPERVGRAPRIVLLFRQDEPFKKIVSTKFSVGGDPDLPSHQIEILARGQQGLCCGIHIGTKQPYKWISILDDDGIEQDYSPLTVHRDKLPVLTLAMVDDLIDYFHALVAKKRPDWAPLKAKKRPRLSTKKLQVIKEAEKAKKRANTKTPDMSEAIQRAIEEDSDFAYMWDDGQIVGEEFDASGFIKVYCPKKEGHSDGRDFAYYSPIGQGPDPDELAKHDTGKGGKARAKALAKALKASRQFKCHHASCESGGHSTLEAFRNNLHIESEGLAGVPALAALNPRDYALMKEKSGKIYEYKTGSLIAKDTFNLIWSPKYPGGKGKDSLSASTVFAKAAMANDDVIVADGFCWHPSGIERPTYPPIIKRDDRILINQWRGLAIKPVAGDVGPWLALMEFLVPDDRERNLLLCWLAFLIQHIDEKPNWQILMAGTRRIGKDLLIKPIMQIFGDAAGTLDGKDAKLKWGDPFFQRKFVVLEELKEQQNKDFANDLKTKAAATGSGRMTINKKGGDMSEQSDVLGFMGFSNYRDCVAIDKDDMRYFVIFCFQKVKPPKYYEDYSSWLDDDGAAHVLDYLLSVDLSAFNANTLPYFTEAAKTMAGGSNTDAMQIMLGWIEEGTYPFDRDTVTQAVIMEELNAHRLKPTLNEVRENLHDAGFSPYRGRCNIDKKTHSISFWSCEDFSEFKSSELYDIATTERDRGRVSSE